MKATIYARYSSDLQRQASIADQYRTCLARIEREGWTLAAKFKDEALSGARSDRPGYQALIEAAKRKEFDVIVVEEVSRLWRDQEEQHKAVKHLKYRGVHLVGCNDGIDTRQGYGLLLGIRGAINEEAREEIAKRTHRGLAGVALNGNSAGGRSFGYKHFAVEHPTKKDHLGRPIVVAVKRKVNTEEAKWVRWIFERYADGWTSFAIARELNAKGVTPPGAAWNHKRRKCKGWGRSAIYGDQTRGFGILLNPLYRGQIVWNRTRKVTDPDTGARRHVPRPESEWVVCDAPHLRIVPEELWQRVNARLVETRQTQRSQATRNGLKRLGRSPAYLLSGILKCDVCGGKYTIVGDQHYGCANHKEQGICPNKLRVRRDKLEAKVLEGIKEDLFKPEQIEKLKRAVAKCLAEARKERRPDAKANEEKLASIEQEIANMVDAIKRGAYCEELQAELDRAKAERERLVNALNVRGLDKISDFLPRLVERYRKFVDKLDAKTMDVARARTQIRKLVGGEIRIIPGEGKALYAEMRGDYGGLLKVSNASAIMVVPRRGLEPPRGCPH